MDDNYSALDKCYVFVLAWMTSTTLEGIASRLGVAPDACLATAQVLRSRGVNLPEVGSGKGWRDAIWGE